MKISKFEDLIVWQESKNLLVITYKTVSKFPPEEKFNMAKHVRECSRNIPGNIAEGFGRFHYQDSMQFYRIARGSLMELKSDIYCALDLNYISKEEAQTVLDQIDKVGSLLNGLIRTVIKFKSQKPE